jgi:hypothetical protein
LLKDGKEYTKEADRHIVKHYAIINSAKLKECFKNSLLLALVCDDIDYVEGYYLCEGVPLALEHAWNIKGDEVIDTTSFKVKGAVLERFGVKIPKDALKKYIKTNQELTALQFYYLEYHETVC